MQKYSLVYHTGGLGDFITAFPAIAEWNRGIKGCRKILLGKPSYGILGVHAGLFDEVWDAESAAFSWLYDLQLSAPLPQKGMLSGIQSAMLFTSQDSPVLARFRQIGIKKLLFQDPFPQKRIPVAAYHLSLFDKISKTASKADPKLVSHPEYKNEADKLLEDVGKFVAFHPGSGNGIKNWPVKKFEALAAMIREKGFRIVWIAGPAEQDLSSPSIDILVRNAPLPLLVHIFARSCLYVGNDSGISHLAATCGALSVILFGPSDPEVWKPAGENIVIVKADRRECFPCHPSKNKYNKEPLKCRDSCMNTISVLKVFDACEKVLKTVEGR